MSRTKNMKLKQYITNKKPNKYSIKGLEVEVSNLGLMDYEKTKSQIIKFQKVIPPFLRRGIKKIVIGTSDHMAKNDFSGMFRSGVIYLSNSEQDETILDELVHETAHSVEELHKEDIYSDGEISREFIIKREALWYRLKNKGFEIPLDTFLDLQYSKEVDYFLYKKVGYSTLRSLSYDLFFSPYAATSVREYFANAFEAYWLREEPGRLKKLSPKLYNKIINITELEK